MTEHAIKSKSGWQGRGFSYMRPGEFFQDPWQRWLVVIRLNERTRTFMVDPWLSLSPDHLTAVVRPPVQRLIPAFIHWWGGRLCRACAVVVSRHSYTSDHATLQRIAQSGKPWHQQNNTRRDLLSSHDNVLQHSGVRRWTERVVVSNCLKF